MWYRHARLRYYIKPTTPRWLCLSHMLHSRVKNQLFVWIVLVIIQRMPQEWTFNHSSSQSRGILQTRVLAMWTRNTEVKPCSSTISVLCSVLCTANPSTLNLRLNVPSEGQSNNGKVSRQRIRVSEGQSNNCKVSRQRTRVSMTGIRTPSLLIKNTRAWVKQSD